MTSINRTSSAELPDWSALTSRLSSQLQAVKDTTAEISTRFGSLLANVASTPSGGSMSSATSSAKPMSSAVSSGTTTPLAASTLTALLQASASATAAASTAAKTLKTSQASAVTSDAAMASRGTARLLALGATNVPSARPCIAEFMKATGVDDSTACEVLYGTIGSNQDLRDWASIMKSETPLADARASTAAMYASELPYVSPHARKPEPDGLLASTENLALISWADPSGARAPRLDVTLLDGQGNILRVQRDPAMLATDARNFGIDTSQLAKLTKKLDASGIQWRKGAWANGLEP